MAGVALDNNSLRGCSVRSAAFACALVCSVLQPLVAQQPQRGRVAATCSSASQCLSLGRFYLDNGDITDRAVSYLRTATTRYAGAAESEQAQYLLGSYYQRKFYVLRQRNRQEDAALLHRAQAEFRTYVERYAVNGAGSWLADAHFYAALACVQLRDTLAAKNLLVRMEQAAARDRTVYIYQVVWSAGGSDVVDDQIDSRALAGQAGALLGRSSDQFLSELTRWCQFQRGRRAVRR